MRYHSYHQAMKRLIAEGKLGQIVSMRAQLTCWYPEIPGNWRQDKARSGGGALMDMGIQLRRPATVYFRPAGGRSPPL